MKKQNVVIIIIFFFFLLLSCLDNMQTKYEWKKSLKRDAINLRVM